MFPDCDMFLLHRTLALGCNNGSDWSLDADMFSHRQHKPIGNTFIYSQLTEYFNQSFDADNSTFQNFIYHNQVSYSTFQTLIYHNQVSYGALNSTFQNFIYHNQFSSGTL